MRNLVKLLANGLYPHRKTILGFLILSLLAAGMQTAAPALMGKGIDSAVSKSAWHVIGLFLGAWTATRLIAEWFRQIISKHGELISMKVGRADNLRRIMALMDKPMVLHVDQKRRDVTSSISRLRWQLQNIIDLSLFDVLPTVVSAIAAIAYVATMDVTIAAALFGTIAGYVYYTARFAPARNESLRAWNKLNGEVDDFQWDAIENVMLVKSCTNEEFVRAAILQRQAKVQASEVTMVDVGIRQRFGQQIILLVGGSAATALAVAALSAGRFSVGQVSAVIAYAFSVFGYVQNTSWTIRSMFEVSSVLEKVDAFLAHAPEDFETGKSVALTGAVEFRHVAFRYRDDKAVLEDASFSTGAGHRIALVGKSGEGKTTIVDLIGRYYAPSSGEILIDGTRLQDINLRSLRSQIGYVPQETTLFHESVAYNIRFGRPDATDQELRTAAKQAKIDEFIESLPEKYETVVGEKGLKLSGGQRQRISLARAFLRNPKILILDEPTSQQDSETELGIQQALDELMRGRTTFIIAHRLKTIMDADQILVLKDGRIAESGTHAELARHKDGLYHAALRAQGMVPPESTTLDPKMLN